MELRFTSQYSKTGSLLTAAGSSRPAKSRHAVMATMEAQMRADNSIVDFPSCQEA